MVERWVEAVRRELLDHMIVLNERQLQRLLSEYVAYYHDLSMHANDGPLGVPRQRCWDDCQSNCTRHDPEN